MLGYLRFALAITVSLNHLWVIYGVGRLAVVSFYVISGYLMTAIIQETYGTAPSGIRRYAINRALRIYPSYLIVFVVFSVVLAFFNPADMHAFSLPLSLPWNAFGWLKSLTLIGLDPMEIGRIVPQSWTLYVELCYYALIPVLLIIGRRALLAWLAAAVGYHLYVMAGAADPSLAWDARYGNVMAGSLGFAIGACSRNYLPDLFKSRSAFVGFLVAFCGCYLLSGYWALTGMQPGVLRVLSTVGYYGVMLSAGPVVDYLARLPKNRISEHFGEYSYPFYLLHVPVGFLVFHISGAERKNVLTMLAGIGAALICSWGLIKIDRRISAVRIAVRNKETSAKCNLESRDLTESPC